MSDQPPITVSTDTAPESMTYAELQAAWAQYEPHFGQQPRLSTAQLHHAWAVACEIQRRDDAGHQPTEPSARVETGATGF